MKIQLTQPAFDDLQSTKKYINQENPVAAREVIARVIEAIEKLAAFPAMGRTGRVPDTKEWVVSNTPLIVVYQVKDERLIVVRVIDASRKWP